MAQEIAYKLILCAGNHASILAHKNKWPSAWDDDVAGRVEHTGTIAVSVLFVIALCNCRVRVRGVFLMDFDIQAYQAVFVEGDFGHPLGSEVGFQMDLNIPQVWRSILIFFPDGHGPGVRPRLFQQT